MLNATHLPQTGYFHTKNEVGLVKIWCMKINPHVAQIQGTLMCKVIMYNNLEFLAKLDTRPHPPKLDWYDL